MFEIGNSLREARLRQNVDLARVEQDTRIRAKYLRALEDERFDILPGETYVKGFLRTYADYLGLDGQLYVDEFNSRFARVDEPSPASAPTRPRRSRAVESNLIVVTLAAIVAVTVLFIVAWRFAGDEGPAEYALETRPITSESVPAAPPATATGPAAGANQPPKPRNAKLVLTAARGDCWVQVRAGSARGELLFEGTMFQGETERFTRWKRLWVSVGAPANLNVTLNGRAVKNFPQRQTNLLVGARGIRPA